MTGEVPATTRLEFVSVGCPDTGVGGLVYSGVGRKPGGEGAGGMLKYLP